MGVELDEVQLIEDLGAALDERYPCLDERPTSESDQFRLIQMMRIDASFVSCSNLHPWIAFDWRHYLFLGSYADSIDKSML